MSLRMTRDTTRFSQLFHFLEHKWELTRRIINVVIVLKIRVPIETDGFLGNSSDS